jgi:hypothetical protein
LANHPPQFNKLKHPMSSYSVEFIDGHIIAVINNCKYIVDTGSPSSFGNGKININGSNYNISASGMHGLTATSVSNLSGIQVDGLIGMDILSNFDVTFSESEIRFFDAGSTNGQHTPNAISLPLIDKVMGIPIINMTIHNQVRRIFFDTGAKLSYLSDELLTGASVGEEEDFYPTMGTFKTKVYKVDVQVGNVTENLTFGSLPTQISALLTLGNTKGIVGTELLNKYDITLTKTELVLEPIGN